MSNEKGILDDLKKMVLITGRLSDVHEKTLKTAPFIFFDHLEKVEISHDIETNSSGSLPGSSRVMFTLSFKDGYETDLQKERTQALINTVHTILWPEVKVSIFDSKGKSLI
jgi:hypothetical protein